jgi:sterol desaturase/sphingolipid hydroxylase (fatty acid hydroxylase superfamily)
MDDEEIYNNKPTLFNDIIDQLYKYGPATILVIIGSYLLKSPDTIGALIPIGLLFMTAWVYFTHRLTHDVYEWGLAREVNTHLLFHHTDDKVIPRWLELVMEFFADHSLNLSIIPFQWIFGVNLVPVPCILLFTFTYVSIHIINYSIIGSKIHRRHHMTKNKNFAPDPYDHIFGTNYNYEREDMNPYIINIIVCFLFLYFNRDIIHHIENEMNRF